MSDDKRNQNGMREVVNQYLATGDKALENKLTTMERVWCCRQKAACGQAARKAGRMKLSKDEPKVAEKEGGQ